ncbi:MULTISPECIES: FGGY-family carbohydrate kinase [Providencia]|uniref:FGGY-family carbohydrate kinase n=1 Tax=Providencia TaxID=586 RepID=UPI00197E6695|nr:MULTISPECIES: FGGY-family carbohydrate kinase [Providencia]MBN4864671.1 carbohydrate kinase [Providencia stuartii]MBN4873883.1 carbohydrate kinase [Providencia stuartii]MBN4878574.1 carbohydrate kinase [Providencia stuartii]MBN4883193.1 carbohydrate kinase [Providencia stuartii]
MSTFFMGVDLGGTVIKAGIYTPEGQEITVAEHPFPTESPEAGFSERNMNELWQASCHVIRDAIKNSRLNASQISGVSFSSHGKGLYLLDKQGKPVRKGIVSSDSRAQAIVDKWHQNGTADNAYPLSLQQLWASHPVALLSWLKENEPDNYRDTGHILMVHDYIRYRLTEQIACEETNISGSQLFNQIQSGYDPKLCQLFGIDEVNDKLAPVINSAELAGTVTRQAAEESGLMEGTPVFGGFFDVVGAALASGVSQKDKLSAVAGTWTISTRVFDEIVPSDYPYVWSKYCIPGTYFVHEGSPTSASNLAWFTRHFFNQRLQDYDVLNHCVAEGATRKNDILFFPWLYGSNYHSNLHGGLLGLSSHHTDADIVYAIYQGIVFSHLLHQDRIVGLDNATESIRFTGGPTQSPLWMQMFCDASNLPLDVVNVQQSGCQAAALCAAVGSGYYSGFDEAIAASTPKITTYQPNALGHQQLRDKFTRFKAVADALSRH